MKKLAIILVPLFFTKLTFAQSEGHHHSEAQEKPEQSAVTQLSQPLRQLLIKEMQALQQGLIQITGHYIAGEWQPIKKIALQMKNSFILKQHLTDAQKQELHQKLPHQFIEKDKNFHYLAGMLAHAAEKEKTELVSFYLSQVQQSCLGCHSQFAGHRFQYLGSLAQPQQESAEHKH